MKSNIAKLAALLLAASMCAALAGCGDSKTEDNSNKDQVDAALSELDNEEKEELNEIKDEINAEISDAENTSSEAEAPAEDLGLKNPKYYTYYEDLAKAYAESDINNYAGDYFYTASVSSPVYANDKVYIDSTKNGTKLFCYDIASGSLETLLDFEKAEGKYDYDSWFVKGDDLYLMYSETVYGDEHIEKVGKDGKVTDYDITEGLDVGKIEYVFDNGKILVDINSERNFEVYDPADGTITQLDPIAIPSDHAGVTEDAEKPIFMFAKGNSFYFGNTRSSMLGGPYLDKETIYEYNTDTNEVTVFYNDEILSKEDPKIKIFGDYLMIDYKESLDRKLTVVKISDGTKIVDDVRVFSPYLGGDGSYFRDLRDKKWYRLRYPDSTCTQTYEKSDTLKEAGEELSDEPAEVGSSIIVQLNDKYYVMYDDAGYFLRTYEKGSAEEQLIMTQKQADGEE